MQQEANIPSLCRMSDMLSAVMQIFSVLSNTVLSSTVPRMELVSSSGSTSGRKKSERESVMHDVSRSVQSFQLRYRKFPKYSDTQKMCCNYFKI